MSTQVLSFDFEEERSVSNFDVASELQKKPAIVVAACNGDTEALANMLAAGDKVNTVGPMSGASLLYIAAQNGHDSVVELLLQHHADPNIATSDGVQPIHVASQNGDTNIVKMLLQHGANPSRRATKRKLNPLYLAAQNGHSEVVQLLLQHDAKAADAVGSGLTPLHIAVHNGHDDVAVAILQVSNSVVNARGVQGETPLLFAARFGYENVIDTLLRHGASPDLADSNGVTPLITASQQGHLGAVELLLQAHATVDLATTFGLTALHVAAEKGNEEIVELLLDVAASATRVTTLRKLTAYDLAAARGHGGLAALLLSRQLAEQGGKGHEAVQIAQRRLHQQQRQLANQHHTPPPLPYSQPGVPQGTSPQPPVLNLPGESSVRR